MLLMAFYLISNNNETTDKEKHNNMHKHIGLNIVTSKSIHESINSDKNTE